MPTYSRKLLLSFTDETVAALDEAANALGMCRSEVIRRSLTRDLKYVMDYEVPDMLRFHQETAAAHTSWLTSRRWLD
ncbi:MAG: ribbon-helix-helix protein, CopG family [Hyphomicrobium sp.]|nr:ribbon-helix-helix protein, CopG family [Hyphomicrobium sp.]